MMMIQSKETLNYHGEKPYIKAVFEIELQDDKLQGKAWVEDYPNLQVELKDRLFGEDPFKETKNLKYWLEADLCNLILEFENGVNK